MFPNTTFNVKASQWNRLGRTKVIQADMGNEPFLFDDKGNLLVSQENISDTAAALDHVVKTLGAVGSGPIGSSSTLVESVLIKAKHGNTGNVWIGKSSQQNMPLPVSIGAPPGKKIDLADIYFRVDTVGDGVVILTLN